MDEWTHWPVREMLLACTFLIGIVAAILLLVNKYPSSRWLGRLIVSYLVLTILIVLNETIFMWVALLIVSACLFLYSYAFFNQNTRIKLKHIGPVIFLIILLLVLQITEIRFPFVSIITIATVGYLFSSIIYLNKESKIRGIHWFQNPGNRLIWFRNFFGFNTLIIIYFLSRLDAISIEETSLILLTNLGIVYFQIFKESAFLSPIPLGNKYQKSTLTSDQKAAILEKLDQMLVRDKFYLNDSTSLGQLASNLNTTTHHLSQVLNESKGVSFQELISQYRIREARLFLKNGDHRNTKIENIAAMVGYNSKSAFNTAFKKYTELTPTEFRKSKDVRTYREEPLPDRKIPNSSSLKLSLYHVLLSKFNTNMIYNFLKIFYRTLLRNKFFSFIKLFGLVIGFSSSMLIYLFITHELSYDQSLPESDQIYRVAWMSENPQTRTPHPMAQAMTRDMPEVEAATSLSPWYGAGLNKQTIRVKNNQNNVLFEEPDFYFADSTFLDVFDLEIVAGDPNALRKPWNIVITDIMATKYFKDENPIGKELTVNNMPVEVAAVLKGMPDQSHFHFQALISYVTLKSINPNNPWLDWADFGHFNYIKLKTGADLNQLKAKIPAWVLPYFDWELDRKEALLSGENRFELQPIQDIHLKSNIRWELEPNGNILYIYILTGTLIFILLIAGINYVNLTTANSLERAKEIGIRKSLGAISGNLSIQFYLESILFCFLALVFAFALSILVIDTFNHIAGISFNITDILNIAFVFKATAICFFIALIAGFYPALSLTSIIPTDILKGKFSTSTTGNRIRSVLVIVQFLISSILIAGSLIILNQIDFMKSKELGFDKKAIVSIKVNPDVRIGGINLDQVNGLQNQFKSISGVRKVATVSNLPGDQFNQNSIYSEDTPENKVDASEMYVDFSSIETLGLEIIKGRNFEITYSADSSGSNVLLNESAVRQLNLIDPIGKKISWDSDQNNKDRTVVGIIKDFHYKSLHQTIQPLIVQVDPLFINKIIVKMDGSQFQQTLKELETVYGTFETEFPFEYRFLDMDLASLYQREVRTLNIFSIFAALALFLACLGLIGMAVALLNQKIKEVGIRKILGASSQQIVTMILGQFAKLILIALVIGLPISYLLMQNWIAEFSYQAPFGLLPFVIAGTILMAVGIVSIIVVVLKTALANPVEALRYE